MKLAKNVVINEGGALKSFVAEKLRTTSETGESINWIPEDQIMVTNGKELEMRATVDNNVGIPTVIISSETTETAQTFQFDFKNLKGEPSGVLVVKTVSEMTDKTKAYVYIGSESGYVNGDWYYYDGSAWISGGVYNSMPLETDATLTIGGAAADAEVVGDAIGKVQENVSDLNNSIYDNLTLQPTAGKYCKPDGTLGNNSVWRTLKARIDDVFYTDTLNGTGTVISYSTTYPAIVYTDKSGTVLDTVFTATVKSINTINKDDVPNGAYYINLNSSNFFTVYTKSVYSNIHDVFENIENVKNNYLYPLNGKTTFSWNIREGAFGIYSYKMVAGKWYKFTNNTSAPIGLYARVTVDETTSTITTNLEAGKSIIYKATKSTNYLRVARNASGDVECLDLSTIIPQTAEYVALSPYHKLKYIYDARALGGSTDDDIALQNYIDNESYVYIPAGTYWLNKPLEINRIGTIIEGAGYGFKTVLRPENNNTTALIVAHRNTQNNSLMMTLRNLCFCTVNRDGTSNTGCAITSRYYEGNSLVANKSVIIDSKIENCWFNGGNDALNPILSTAISGHFTQTIILGCWFEMFNKCIEILNISGNASGNIISNCSFWNNVNHLHLQGHNNIWGCEFTAAKGGYIVKSDAKSNILFSDNYISLSANKNISSVTYPNANGILFDCNDSSSNINVDSTTIVDSNDDYEENGTESLYEYFANITNGIITAKNINARKIKHLEKANNINNDSCVYYNLLESVCETAQYSGTSIQTNNLVQNCYMEITATKNTTVTVSKDNERYNVFIKQNAKVFVPQYDGINTLHSSNGNITVQAFRKV